MTTSGFPSLLDVARHISLWGLSADGEHANFPLTFLDPSKRFSRIEPKELVLHTESNSELMPYERLLTEFDGRVSDSGEGRWTSIAAIDEGVPTPVLTTALYSRFESQLQEDFADKILSAMRKGFGGHEEKAAPTG